MKSFRSIFAVPWVIAALPLLATACLGVLIAEAMFHVGHLPRYMVDSDPFHNHWGFIFPNAFGYLYLACFILLIPWMISMIVFLVRYSGKRRVWFYLLTCGSAACIWIFFISDATGFIRWSLD